MKVLGPFVDRLRLQRQTRKIPAFDPADGGSAAKVLFLLEPPGPGAVRSGLISRNNKDETAANFNGLLAEAGIAPAETLLWNVVPGTSATTKAQKSVPHALPIFGMPQSTWSNCSACCRLGAQWCSLVVRRSTRVSPRSLRTQFQGWVFSSATTLRR